MAGRPQRTELSEKHWKALNLCKEGGRSFRDIAKEVGWSEDYFDDLRHGNTEKGGSIATLFQEEFKKIEAKQDEQTQELLKKNIKTAQTLLERILEEFSQRKKLDKDEKKLVGTLTNVLSNCQPNVSIKNTQFNYVKGLTPEELIHEFKRLKSIAESSFDRRRVQSSESGGSGELPTPD